MEEGIVIGPESQQKDTEDFNKKTLHIKDEGKIANLQEGDSPDLVAFVLFATNISDPRRIGLSYEFQSPIKKSMIKAFTFEIPDGFDGDIRDLVIQEVLLQTGFQIGLAQVEYLDKSYIGPKEGRFCHHFGITVDKTMEMQKASNENKVIQSSHYWAMNEEIKEMQDWMAQITCIKRYTSKVNSIIISGNLAKQ